MTKKKNKLNKFVIIGSIYFITLLTISITYSFFNTDLSMKAKVQKLNDKNNSEYILVSSKKVDGAYLYHYIVNFKYNGVKKVLGWKYHIKIPYDTEVLGCYNAESCTVNGEILTVINDQNNGILEPNNQNAAFSFKIKTNKKFSKKSLKN